MELKDVGQVGVSSARRLVVIRYQREMIKAVRDSNDMDLYECLVDTMAEHVDCIYVETVANVIPFPEGAVIDMCVQVLQHRGVYTLKAKTAISLMSFVLSVTMPPDFIFDRLNQQLKGNWLCFLLDKTGPTSDPNLARLVEESTPQQRETWPERIRVLATFQLCLHTNIIRPSFNDLHPLLPSMITIHRNVDIFSAVLDQHFKLLCSSDRDEDEATAEYLFTKIARHLPLLYWRVMESGNIYKPLLHSMVAELIDIAYTHQVPARTEPLLLTPFDVRMQCLRQSAITLCKASPVVNDSFYGRHKYKLQAFFKSWEAYFLKVTTAFKKVFRDHQSRPTNRNLALIDICVAFTMTASVKANENDDEVQRVEEIFSYLPNFLSDEGCTRRFWETWCIRYRQEANLREVLVRGTIGMVEACDCGGQLFNILTPDQQTCILDTLTSRNNSPGDAVVRLRKWVVDKMAS